MKKKSDKESLKREKELVARCIQGDKDAWGEFVDGYKGLIYNTIIRTFQLTGYKNTAENKDDLFQDVFRLLLKDQCAKLRSFKWKNDCSLVFWLGVVTRNLTLDYVRKNFSREKIFSSQALGAAREEMIDKDDTLRDISFLDDIEEGEKLALFEQALTRMSKKDLCLIELIYFRELPHERVAALMGKSIDAVYMQKKRVIEKLKRVVKNDLGLRINRI